MEPSRNPDPDAATDFETLFLETLGPPFLAFVLGLEARPSQPDPLRGGEELSEPQRAVLHELATFIAGLRASLPASEQANLAFYLSQLFDFRPELGMAWPSWARLQTVGSLGLPRSDDPVLTPLIELARDQYPAFLLPPLDREWLGPGHLHLSAPSLYRHPQNAAFTAAIMEDPSLRRLFPSIDETGPTGSVFRSTGSGGGSQLVLFASMLLSSAWSSACRVAPEPTLGGLIEELNRALQVLRAAVDGRRVMIPAVMGLAGVRIHRGQALALPGGALVRPATDADRSSAPPSLSGKVTATSADGRHVEADYSGDLVLEMEVPYLLKVADGHEWTHPFPVDLVSHDAVSRTLQDLRLGLMLSADQASPANVARTWLRFYEPLGHGGMSWSDPRRAAQFTPTFLDWRQVRSWREWTLRVATHRKSNIEVAIRRTLSAASERVDPADSLIDSVIAWENLVGSRQGESTLRVSAALAWLLGESLEDREAIRAQVSRLYSLRSQVVHGNKDLEAGDAIGPRAEALHITLRTLRALFHERAFLLDESRDGTELGTRLIMGE